RRPRYVRHICWLRRCTRGLPARARSSSAGAAARRSGPVGKKRGGREKKGAEGCWTLLLRGSFLKTKKTQRAGRPAKSAGAAGRIRTVNLSLTKRLLCR